MKTKIKLLIELQMPGIIAGLIVGFFLLSVYPSSRIPLAASENTLYSELEENVIMDINSKEVNFNMEEMGVKDIKTITMESSLNGVFTFDENVMFEFRNNNSYYGFFDSENTYKENLKYQIQTESDRTYLYIINEEDNQYVKYEIESFDENEMILIYGKNRRLNLSK